MSNSLVYEGYAARIEFSSHDECFIGHIAGIKDVVGFHGETVSELKAAFQEAVNDYLATCNIVGKTPQKPYSGKLMLRIRPEIHAAVATAAELSGHLKRLTEKRAYKNLTRAIKQIWVNWPIFRAAQQKSGQFTQTVVASVRC